jgi:hypothetical protein
MKIKNYGKFCWLLAGLTLPLNGCNLFGGIDSPKGDAQLLSAARACFDQGDLACARENYAKLSGNLADIKNSELAYAILEEQGAGMSEFMQALGDGDAGKGLTRMAGFLSRTAGQTKRAAIYEALKAVDTISDSGLRGLVRFSASFVLAAVILAEDAGADGSLLKSEYVSNPTTCANASTTTCAATAACDLASTSVLINGATVTNITTTNTPSSTTATTAIASGGGSHAMLVSLMGSIDYALTTELAAAGKFKLGTGSLASSINALSTGWVAVAGGRCVRNLLLSTGVGN